MKTVVWLGDQHAPSHDPVAHRAVCKFLKAYRPDEIIIGGDLLDMDALSSHNVGKLRKIAQASIIEEYDSGKRLLDDYQKFSKKLTYLQGNHEYRVDRWIEANPQFQNLLEVPLMLDLKGRGIRWINSWEDKTKLYRIAKAGFIHGVSHAADHAKIMAGMFDCNIFYGHVHDGNCFQRAFSGEKYQRIAQSCGCLCAYNQSYLRGRPTNWQQGFAVFYFRDDGFFNYDFIKIFNGSFIYGKELFDGRK